VRFIFPGQGQEDPPLAQLLATIYGLTRFRGVSRVTDGPMPSVAVSLENPTLGGVSP
jgi:hypothetical protein